MPVELIHDMLIQNATQHSHIETCCRISCCHRVSLLCDCCCYFCHYYTYYYCLYFFQSVWKAICSISNSVEEL